MTHASYPDLHVVRLKADVPVMFDCVQAWGDASASAGGAAALAFDVWYARHHAPAAGPSERALRRYAAPAHAAYFSVEELQPDDLPKIMHTQWPAPKSPTGTGHLRCLGLPLGSACRFDGGPLALEARYAYPVFFRVPPNWQAAFNDWYDREHIPMLLLCPQWLMCRRFALQAVANCPWTHMALHYLSDLSALESAERDAARSTPWRRELEQQPWFQFTHRLGNRLA
jgi:hypothetical protein